MGINGDFMGFLWEFSGTILKIHGDFMGFTGDFMKVVPQ
jgi:hypothetical protein